MKAIIVSETELNALLDRLELVSLRKATHWPGQKPDSQEITEAHRAFHYEVTRWIQEVGGTGWRRG